MTQTKKFSQFNGPDPIQAGDIVVGLRNDGTGFYDNWQFTDVGSGGGGGGSVTIVVNQPTAGLSAGQWVRRDPTVSSPGALYTPALANNAANAEIIGSVLNILNADQFTLQVIGYVGSGTPGFSGFTPGEVYFLSDMTPGLITLIEPTENGSVSLPCFIAETVDSGWIRQSRGLIIAGTGPIPPSGSGGTDNTQHMVNQPGNPFDVGDWVRVVGDTIYDYADGTSLGNSQAIGVVTAIASPVFTVQQSGWSHAVVTQDDASNPLVAGTVYYLSDTVPGQITSTPPSILGHSTRPVFISESPASQSGWIFPQRPLNVGVTDPEIQFVHQVAHGFARGDVVYIDAANHYAKAIATSLATSEAVGFVVSVVDADDFVLQTAGFSDQFIAPFTPLVPPAQYYLSDATPGAITQTEPVALTSYSKPMLAPSSATSGYILEQRPILNSVLHPIAGNGNVFLGYLNQANNFSNTTILQDTFGHTFQLYLLFIEEGTVGPGGGINGTAGVAASMGLQLYIGGAWITVGYNCFTSGILSPAGSNIATQWANVKNNATAESLIIFPAFSTLPSLTCGNLSFNNTSSTHLLTYNTYNQDLFSAPIVGYTCVGTSGNGSAGIATGMRVWVSNGGNILPAQGGYISVYGIPHS